MSGRTVVIADSDRLEDVKRAHVLRVYRKHGGNKARTAVALGVCIKSVRAWLAAWDGRCICDGGGGAALGTSACKRCGQ